MEVDGRRSKLRSERRPPVGGSINKSDSALALERAEGGEVSSKLPPYPKVITDATAANNPADTLPPITAFLVETVPCLGGSTESVSLSVLSGSGRDEGWLFVEDDMFAPLAGVKC